LISKEIFIGTDIEWGSVTMNAKHLPRHLLWAVLLKLIALTVLWFALIKDTRVRADTEAVAGHMGMPATAQGATK
jgi:hypothetical protein